MLAVLVDRYAKIVIDAEFLLSSADCPYSVWLSGMSICSCDVQGADM